MNDIVRPRVLRIEPASQCNLSCSHCPTGTIQMERGVMGEEVFSKCLEYIKTNRDTLKVVVLYHGGEPLLNKNFPSYVTRIREANPQLHIKTVTNGVALNKKNQENIINSGLDLIEISLDGISKEESQQIRVGSNTEKIISNIKEFIAQKRALGASKPTFYISTTQFIDTDKPLHDQVPEAPEWLRQEFREHLEAGDIVDFKSTFAMRWPHMGLDPSLYGTIDDIEDSDDKRYCDHVFYTMTIRSDGTVLPCCYDLTSKLKMGNVLESPIEEIFSNKKYHELRAMMSRGQYPGICNTCNVVKRNKYLIPLWRTAEKQAAAV